MKNKNKLILIITLATLIFSSGLQAQNSNTSERYGKTLNLGVGVGGYSGYYGYLEQSLPVFNINYELTVAKNFTLAPSISFYSYRRDYYWGDKNNPYRNYRYRETVVPIGLKGTYYLDQALRAGSKWDFYLAGSIGFAVVNSHWDNTYYGDKDYYRRANPLYLDVHAGAEYHFNNKVGMFLDVSTGVSTIGLAFH